MNEKLQTNTKKMQDDWMVIKKHQILKPREKVESLLGSYDLLEKKIGKGYRKLLIQQQFHA